MIKSELAGSGSDTASTALRLESLLGSIRGASGFAWVPGQLGGVAGRSTAMSDFREKDRLLLGSDAKA